MKPYPIALFLLLLPLCLGAKGHYDYSPLAREAHALATALRLEEASVAIARLKAEEPDNLVAYHVENYIDFFTIYVGQNQADFDRLKANRDRRLSILNARGDANSPWHRYIQADIRLQWALTRIIFEEYLTAFGDMNKAYKLLADNQARFPDFMPTHQRICILHAAASTIPDQYQWAVGLLSSIKGDLARSRREINRVVRHAQADPTYVFAAEARATQALMLRHLQDDPQGAWRAVQRASFDPKANPLHCFVMAHIAIGADHNDRAIALLHDRPSGRQFLPFPYMHLMLGMCHLRRLDQGADRHFKRYISQTRSLHYIKEAYQKLAWYEWAVQGHEAGYRSYMKACLAQGSKASSADESAWREAKSGLLPASVLLKARLLFDGGYYPRAHGLLAAHPAASFTEQEHRLEHLYRTARVLEGLQRHEEALQQYAEVVAKGARHPRAFACRAALQSGRLHEAAGQPEQAIAAYKQCLALSPNEYKYGLHQQAKAGLARVRKRG